MMPQATPAPWKSWPLLAAAAAAVMLAVAHGFQSFGGYQPCDLCLRQREVYWAAVATGLIGFGLGQTGRRHERTAALILGVLFVVGAVVAAYHAGAEWKWWPGPTACGSQPGGAISEAAMADLFTGARIRGPACDVAAWRLDGISMAGYNVVISIVLAIISLLVAFRGKLRR